ncbi:ATP-binding protein [Helicobacter apodemus]|uniref:ATP-binding protein n=1 Tax=Helicobacter apodemus TaxID=135569 RepID=A0A4U8UEB4_9HELI|nr:ATP-binding protein [Helicobacter apodemus]MDE6958187.1 ATP-binding protein [Helicobacter apodemus]TLE16129.1 ATP-binding protein [Helicobacter apodemus]
MELNWEFDRYLASIYRSSGYLHCIEEIEFIDFKEFVGLEKEIALLCQNTQSFLSNRECVNVLLWGARGCGKSSLIKALLGKYAKEGLRVLQILKQDLQKIPEIFDYLRNKPYKFIIFCDDLSFDRDEKEYKALKTFLEGSIEAFPKNILIYATSNRRHLLQQFHDENEIFGFEGDEDKIALSDRFPLCIGFYSYGHKEYLEVLAQCFKKSNIYDEFAHIQQKAINYATQKGSKSPRIAKQFFKLYQSGLIDILYKERE